MPITINGTGTITGISAGGLPDNCVTAADLATTLDLSSNTVTLPSGTGGKILQVVQTEKTDTSVIQVTAQGQWHDIFSRTITPVAAGSSIHIAWYTSVGTQTQNQRGTFRILRDNNITVIADAASNRTRGSHGSIKTMDTYYAQVASQVFLDTPTYTLGNTLTYKLQASFEQSAGYIYINRDGNWTDSNTHHAGTSHIVLMEVAG
jgi:hypothetical protein